MMLQVLISLLNRNQELPLGDVDNWEGILEMVVTGLWSISRLAWTSRRAAGEKNVCQERQWMI